MIHPQGDIVNMQWTGCLADAEEPWFREFVSWGQLATPRLIWWIEPDLSGLCDLLFTQELTQTPPHRVRPFEWCHRIGGRYAWGRAGVSTGGPTP